MASRAERVPSSLSAGRRLTSDDDDDERAPYYRYLQVHVPYNVLNTTALSQVAYSQFEYGSTAVVS